MKLQNYEKQQQKDDEVCWIGIVSNVANDGVC